MTNALRKIHSGDAHGGGPRDDLLQIIKEQSFSTGNVKLASGQSSNFYFDMKPTMLHPHAIETLAELIFARIKTLRADYVGGLAVGAIPLLAPLSQKAQDGGQFIPGFFVRQKPKDHGTRKVVEGIKNIDDLRGKRVVILDDVTTTGKSAMDAVKATIEAGAKVILVLAVVDRCEGAKAFYDSQSIPFDAIFTAEEFV